MEIRVRSSQLTIWMRRRWQKATSKLTGKNQAPNKDTLLLISSIWLRCLCPQCTKQGHLNHNDLSRKTNPVRSMLLGLVRRKEIIKVATTENFKVGLTFPCQCESAARKKELVPKSSSFDEIWEARRQKPLWFFPIVANSGFLGREGDRCQLLE